ncbi:MAG: oligosaccharide flippase family protein [Chloroflexota bacterium]
MAFWLSGLRSGLRGIRAKVRLTPYDTSTEAGRGAERYRRAALTAIASAAARIVSLATVLLTVPITLSYLGAERYGVVVTITALTAMLVFADFGLGNGLMNLVAAAKGRDDQRAVRVSVSSAFFMLTGVAAVLAIPSYMLYRFVPWTSFMNVGPEHADEVSTAVAIFLASVLVNLPLGIVHRVQLALQEGFVNSLWNAIGSIASIAGVLLAVQLRGDLSWIVLALVGGPVVANSLNWLWLFLVRHRDFRPRWSAATVSDGRRLARIGALFFVLQLSVAFAYQSDVVVATRVIGPQAATDYSVTFRLFMIVPTIVNMVLLPLWPAYSEALARGDGRWVLRTLRLSVLTALVASGFSSLVLIAFGSTILNLWVGSRVVASVPLLLGMGAWAVLSNVSTAVAMLLNGASVMRLQVATAITMAIASPVASIVLGRAFGVAGIIWGTVIAQALCTAIPTAFFLSGFVRRLDRLRAVQHNRPTVA